MPPLYLLLKPSSLLGPFLLCSLVILLGIRATNFWTWESNQIFISRDVVFHESLFPFANIQHPNTKFPISKAFYPQIIPNGSCRISTDNARSNVLWHAIKQPRRDNGVGAIPSSDQGAICIGRRTQNRTVHKTKLPFSVESHSHRSSPEVVVVISYGLRNKKQNGMIGCMKKIVAILVLSHGKHQEIARKCARKRGKANKSERIRVSRWEENAEAKEGRDSTLFWYHITGMNEMNAKLIQ